MNFFDNLPFASVTYLAGAGLAILAYINGDLSVIQAFEALGLTGGAGFGVGYVRNQAGRGVKK